MVSTGFGYSIDNGCRRIGSHLDTPSGSRFLRKKSKKILAPDFK